MKIQRQITILKNNVYRLRYHYQLPSYLCILILNLNINSDVNYVKSLKNDCEHLLRIKDYYKMYPMIHDDVNNQLRDKYKFWTRKD